MNSGGFENLQFFVLVVILIILLSFRTFQKLKVIDLGILTHFALQKRSNSISFNQAVENVHKVLVLRTGPSMACGPLNRTNHGFGPSNRINDSIWVLRSISTVMFVLSNYLSSVGHLLPLKLHPRQSVSQPIYHYCFRTVRHAVGCTSSETAKHPTNSRLPTVTQQLKSDEQREKNEREQNIKHGNEREREREKERARV